MDKNEHIKYLNRGIAFDKHIEKESLKQASRAQEKGNSRMLNLLGVKAYYDMINGAPLEEQTFISLYGLEVDPRSTQSFQEGLARGERLASAGTLEETVQKINETIENLEKVRKTR